MKTVSCNDLGVPNCQFTAKGNALNDLVDQMKQHVQVSHPDYWESKMKDMKDSDITDMIRKKMKEE